MKAALVTGASSGIGLAVTHKLMQLNYRVYGVARDWSGVSLPQDLFVPLSCDLRDTWQMEQLPERFRTSGDELHILLNNAGVGYFGPHETLKPAQLEEMVQTNLLAPLILTQLFLREIRRHRGYIIQIASITAKMISTHGCAYAATKAGVAHFANSLFAEVRKSGVKVVTLYPDIVQTPFYDHLDFRQGDSPDSYITPACVADAIETILSQREGTIITELTLRPQRHQIMRKNNRPKP